MPGMIITVQPQLNDPAIRMGFGIGDSVLITKDGYEVLTEFRKDTIY
jgi:Xaa-Pro aminopeptidase